MTDTSPVQIVCPACGTINRVPAHKLSDRPLCGKCRSALLNGRPIEATDQNFRRFIDTSGLPVVVDFWAPWCGPCRQFAPVFSQVAAEMATRATFIKLDTRPTRALRRITKSVPFLP